MNSSHNITTSNILILLLILIIIFVIILIINHFPKNDLTLETNNAIKPIDKEVKRQKILPNVNVTKHMAIITNEPDKIQIVSTTITKSPEKDQISINNEIHNNSADPVLTCPNCQTKINKEEYFCYKCGFQLKIQKLEDPNLKK